MMAAFIERPSDLIMLYANSNEGSIKKDVQRWHSGTIVTDEVPPPGALRQRPAPFLQYDTQ